MKGFAHMLRLSVSFFIDPEADQPYKVPYPNGNVRSVREAREQGLLPPPDNKILIKEAVACTWLSAVFLILLFTCLGAIYAGMSGFITLPHEVYVVLFSLAVVCLLIIPTAIKAADLHPLTSTDE